MQILEEVRETALNEAADIIHGHQMEFIQEDLKSVKENLNRIRAINEPAPKPLERLNNGELEKIGWRHFNKLNDHNLRAAVRMGYRAAEAKLLGTPPGTGITGDNQDG